MPLQSTAGRIFLWFAFLGTVNVLSGVLAVAFDYPSLWGGRSNIFAEYAYPGLPQWALAHWISMLPLSLLVAGMSMWQRAWISRARWLLLAGIAVCLFIEVKLPYGRLNGNPFVLFIFVDLCVALVFSCLFYIPRKIQISVSAVVILVCLGTYYSDSIMRLMPQGDLLATLDIEHIRKEKLIRYHFEVQPAVEPGSPPHPIQICDAAAELFRQVSAVQDDKDDATEIVLFWARPLSEKKNKSFPAGTAGPTKKGDWVCDFSYPQASGYGR